MSSVDLLKHLLGLSEVPRTGWEIRDVDEPQRVAGHVWGVALLTLLFASEEPDVDEARAVNIALVHDIAETEVGDLLIHDGYSSMTAAEKQAREHEAMEGLLADAEDDLPQFADLFALWEEYEERASPEARFVKDMDLIEACLFALKYEEEERYDPDALEDSEFENLDGFFATARETVQSETATALLSRIDDQYRRVRAGETR